MQQLLTFASRIALLVGVLLSVIAVSEVLDLYLGLRELSPFAAASFALAVAVVVLGGAAYLAVQWLAHPPVLLAPPRTEELARDVQHHARWLARYLQRLAENPLVADDGRAEARTAARRLTDGIDLPVAELETLLREVEGTCAEPLLAGVRAHAEREVRRCVRDVMAGVTLSPYRSADLLVVLYRNGSMVLRLAALYGGRPRVAEQLAIVRDTLRVVAAVNFLNFGNKLLEGILAGVPMVGRFADDVAQGIGAGFLTSAVGHAAMGRCEAFHGWDRVVAVETLGASSKRFLVDVRDIFFKDIYPSMRTRLPQADLRDRLGVGIRAALDATLTGVDGLVARPMRAVARGGSSFRERMGRGRARAGVAWQRLTNRARARMARARVPPPGSAGPPLDPTA
jgi:uncharacterized membrane protein YcjF (UPF0283 family)